MILNKISIPLDELNEIYPILNDFAEDISEMDLTEFFSFLIDSKEILPD